MTTLSTAQDLSEQLTELRHDLHRHPEIGLHLPRTQEAVLAALADLPIETTTGVGLSSVTGVLRGTHPDRPEQDAPVVLLRADMDALPVNELADVPYRSQVAGAMHACGHDLHTAMLTGAAPARRPPPRAARRRGPHVPARRGDARRRRPHDRRGRPGRRGSSRRRGLRDPRLRGDRARRPRREPARRHAGRRRRLRGRRGGARRSRLRAAARARPRARGLRDRHGPADDDHAPLRRLRPRRRDRRQPPGRRRPNVIPEDARLVASVRSWSTEPAPASASSPGSSPGASRRPTA